MAQGTRRAGPLHGALGLLVCIALVWSIGSSLVQYPHSLSYFNELVGGPEHGHEHLLDSSIAWGQDLLYLKDWYDAHPEARPFYLATSSAVDPRWAGISFSLPRRSSSDTAASPLTDSGSVAPPPGWYAIDVNFLRGSQLLVIDGDGKRVSPLFVDMGVEDFRPEQACAKVGQSTYIFHVRSDGSARGIASRADSDTPTVARHPSPCEP